MLVNNKETEDLLIGENQKIVSSESAEEKTVSAQVKWWQGLIPRLIEATGFNAFTTAVAGLFLIISLALAAWLGAVHFKNKAELARLEKQHQEALASRDPADPAVIQERLEDAQKLLVDIQTQLTEQNADKVLSNQELIGIQNDTLQKELDELSQPQLNSPIIDLDPKQIAKPAEPNSENTTVIEVPPTASVFNLILHKPETASFPLYQVELFEAKKKKAMWSGQAGQTADPHIILTLNKRISPNGKYKLRLSGVDGKKKEQLSEFEIEVKYLPPPKVGKKKR